VKVGFVGTESTGAGDRLVERGVDASVGCDLVQMVSGLGRVLALDRRAVHARAVARFGAGRMVDEYVAVYRWMLESAPYASPYDTILALER
jgi:hypothetical protein